MRGRDTSYCTATCIDRDFLECRFDYLKIANGITEVRYCGDQLTGTDLLVSGNYVVLTFHSDWVLENKKGFEILFVHEKGNNFTFRAIYTRKEISSKLEKVTTLQLKLFIREEIRRELYRIKDTFCLK